ncbi:hypothetical protein BSPWISOXPB_5607 [uncultured Gammaproteobacteria bacterium]|nr:hypothetical protein BSPWISOXPB_5607 [uncultured Gammaproteobacteria bacterium]
MVGVQHDKTLKINTHKGLPCGNEGFIRKLSDKVGRDLSFKKRGGLKKGGAPFYSPFYSFTKNFYKFCINKISFCYIINMHIIYLCCYVIQNKN